MKMWTRAEGTAAGEEDERGRERGKRGGGNSGKTGYSITVALNSKYIRSTRRH